MSKHSKLDPVFHTKALSKIYEMGEVKVAALRGVDLTIYPGEMIVLLGPSGSGKSTLLNILGGLDYATDGDVFYCNQDLEHTTDKALTQYRREHIGFVFQFYNLLPGLTAQENIEVVTEIVENPMQAIEALEMVGLGDRANHFPAQLSGGEQQRVAIARAIAKNPKVLLCDEPTGALDFETGILVLKALKTVNERLSTTTILITHNATIAQMADRVFHLKDGKIIEEIENTKKRIPEELTW